jgi:hypothetical protein
VRALGCLLVPVDAEEREGGDAERTQGAREVLGDRLHAWFADAGARRIIRPDLAGGKRQSNRPPTISEIQPTSDRNCDDTSRT